MLSKLTAKNQLTIPKKILAHLPGVRYFEVEFTEGRIVLRPVKVYDADLDTIRDKMKKIGLKQDCVAEAIRWVRSNCEESS